MNISVNMRRKNVREGKDRIMGKGITVENGNRNKKRRRTCVRGGQRRMDGYKGK